MRAAHIDEARHARQSSATQAFRELWQARMLWATGALALVGVMAGFILFGSAARLPIRQQPVEPSRIPTASGIEPAPTATLAALESAEVPAADTPRDTRAADTPGCPTPINREDRWQRRQNAHQLMGSLLRRAPVESACQEL